MRIVPAIALFLAACGGGGDEQAVSSDPAPVLSPIPTPAPPPSAAAPSPVPPAPTPAPVASTPAPVGQTPPSAPAAPVASPPASPAPGTSPPASQPPSASMAYQIELQCGMWGVGWRRNHVGPSEPVRPVVPMYPVVFWVDFGVERIDLVSWGFPPDIEAVVTSPIALIEESYNGEIRWTVPDPRPRYGDTSYSFRDGRLINVIQPAGSAEYTYIECGDLRS
jgi:hypothetical protein